MKKAVIAGASGLVGSHVLRLLLESPSYHEVVSLVRRETGSPPPKLDERVVDFAGLDEAPVTSPVDAVFCCLGTTIRKAGSQGAFREVDLQYVLAVARWGLRHRARHFLVVSSMGADPHSRVFYSRTKGEMESAVRAIGYPAVDVFRPSLLVGARSEARRAERVGELVLGVLRPLLIGGLRSYRAIEAGTVARAMVRRAECPAPGHHVHLSEAIAEMGA